MASKKERIARAKAHKDMHRAMISRAEHVGKTYTSEELRAELEKQDKLINTARKLEHNRLRSKQTVTLKKIMGDNPILRSAVRELMLSKRPIEVMVRSMRQMASINNFVKSPKISEKARERAIEALDKIPELAELIKIIQETKAAPKIDAAMREEILKRIKILEAAEKKQLKEEE